MRQLGHEFAAWRAAWEEREESASHGYPAERADFVAAHRAPTFRAFLIAMTGAGWPMSGRAPRRVSGRIAA